MCGPLSIRGRGLKNTRGRDMFRQGGDEGEDEEN